MSQDHSAIRVVFDMLICRADLRTLSGDETIRFQSAIAEARSDLAHSTRAIGQTVYWASLTDSDPDWGLEMGLTLRSIGDLAVMLAILDG